MADLNPFVEKILAGVQGYVSRSLAPLLERLKAVEERQPEKGDKGEDGAHGKDADPEFVKALVIEAVAAVPIPKDGRDGIDGKDAVLDVELIRTEIQKAVDAVPRPADGKDADPALIAKMVGEAVAAIPKPADGTDADPAVVAAMVAKAVAEMPRPADGKDGKDGQDGRDALDLEILESIAPTKRYQRGTFASMRGGIWKAVRPTDMLGPDGDPFAAGWSCIVCGIADAAVEHSDDLRTMAIGIRLSTGVVTHEKFTLPVVIDRGIYKADEEYEAGDGATWDGSFWIAQRKTAIGEKPGDSSGAFRLAVKRGRDGRDGLKGEKGERGAQGKDGLVRG